MGKSLENYDIITKEDVLSNNDLYEDILSVLEENRNEWYQFVSEKREQFIERQKKITNPSVYKTSHIKIHTAQQQRKAFVATFYNNDLQISFQGQDMWDDEQAKKIEMLAEFDKLVMKKDKKDFIRLNHIFDYWVGIELKTGYDKVTNTPTYEVVNPMYWIPDKNGNTINNDFEYHIFEMTTTKNQLERVNKSSETYFNLDKITTQSIWNKTAEEMKNHRLLNDIEDWRRTIEIHNHFIMLNGRKYIATTTNTRSLLIRFEEIKPITSEEKKNPYLVQFPVVVTNKYPLDNDPFWLWDLELILDKQNAINRISNLNLMKHEYDAGFKHVVVDVSKITNPDLLKTRPDWGPIYVPARSSQGEPISNATAPIETFSNVSTDSYNALQYLETEAGKETLFTEANRGVAQANQTLWQAKMQQQNSNLVFWLDADMLSVGIINFRRTIRYRSIQENFTSSKWKVFRVGNGLFGKTVKFKKNDIISWYDPDIKVVSKRVEKEQNAEQLAYMMAQRPLIQQDPSIPKVSKNIFKRKLDELNWVKNDLIYTYTPYTRDERRAINYVEMVNNDIMPKSLFQPGMDLETYRIYLSHANNTKTKEKILWLLEDAMLEDGVGKPQEAQQQLNQWGMATAMWSQLLSNLVSQQMQKGKETSLQPTV